MEGSDHHSEQSGKEIDPWSLVNGHWLLEMTIDQ
jgi:hypothetical protein